MRTWGAHAPFCIALSLCLLHFLCMYSAPYRAIKAAQCGLMNPASSGLSWSCTRGVKLLVKPTWVGFLPLLGMMLGEGCHLLLSSTCETFPNKAPPQPLPTPRGEEADDEAAGNAKAILVRA